jgi:hypothetical protein
MVFTILLSCLTWGTVVLFFVFLVRISARPVPTPPSIESDVVGRDNDGQKRPRPHANARRLPLLIPVK